MPYRVCYFVVCSLFVLCSSLSPLILGTHIILFIRLRVSVLCLSFVFIVCFDLIGLEFIARTSWG